MSAVYSLKTPSGTVWAAVGERGAILIAPPPEVAARDSAPKWVLADSGTESWLRDLKATNGQWCAVGDAGAILRSTNLTRWTQIDTPLAADWVGVVRAERAWVALSSRGWVASANDNLTVEVLPPASSGPVFFTCLAYGNGRYIAAGGNGVMFSSTDLQTWSPQPLATSDTVTKLLYAEGRWLAVAGTTLWVSVDGQTFAPHPFGTTSPMCSIHFIRSVEGRPALWMAAGYNGAALWSTNFIRWTPVPSKFLPVDLHDIRYDNGTWIVVGNRGTSWFAGGNPPDLLPPASYEKFWSNGGVPRANTNSSVFVDVLALAERDNLAIGVGSPGKQLRAHDGLVESPDDTGITDWISGIRYAAGQFMAVGDNGGIYTSTDGADWSALLPTYNHYERDKGYVNTTAHLTSIDAGDGLWIAAGERGTLLRSEDGGKSWPRITPPVSEALYAVRRGTNGTWLSVGENLLVLRSSNTLNWAATHYSAPTNSLSNTNPHPFPIYWEVCDPVTTNGPLHYRERLFGRALRSADYGNGLWVAVGDSGAILTSEDDGVTWKARSSGVVEALHVVRYSPEGWLAAGDDGVTLFSSDAVDWNRQLRTARATLTSLSLQDTNWIAGGIGGVVLAQSRTLRPPFSPTYELRLIIQYNFNSGGFDAVLVWPDGKTPAVLASDVRLDGSFAQTHETLTKQVGDQLVARVPIDPAFPRFFRLQEPTPYK
ncbi:MAG: hypothetical protein HYR88_10165 [Verrucomicrobia bacterium]|nr:hypothetical protein [Verrucomicrobiota bacterium]MBI3868473.1 hypothetical protein [Verrucomicrobiota bacterium]